jgi:ABC-type transporter Mla subunit MlaD
MSKQAQVGLFVLLAIFGVFAVFFVLGDIGTLTRGYKIGVHFRNASGLRTTSVVYLSGVPIGAVDRITLMRDYSTEVILAINPGFEIPVGSRFMIQAPLTGEPTVLIEPPHDVRSGSATMPHQVLDVALQPRGANPVSIADLLAGGQSEMRRLDEVLAQFQKAEPGLLADTKSTLANANLLTTNANRSLGTLTAQVQQLTASLQQTLSISGANVEDLTGNLDSLVKRDTGQVDSLLTQLDRTSRSFGETMDSLHGVATNPQLKANVLSTSRDFALTARTFAQISGDLRNVTGNTQTQAQLRDTVAQLDATTQKVNSLVGSLGGTSDVYGVDKGASPAGTWRDLRSRWAPAARGRRRCRKPRVSRAKRVRALRRVSVLRRLMPRSRACATVSSASPPIWWSCKSGPGISRRYGRAVTIATRARC